MKGPGSWKRLIVSTGGFLWFLSIAGQLLWNGIGLLGPTDNYHFNDERLSISDIGACYQSLLLPSGSSQNCSPLANVLARYVLLLGLFSAWWHPMIKRRLDRRQGQLVGLSDYYKMQATSLIIRGVASYWISTSGQASDPEKLRGVHLFLGISTILVSLSFRH